MFDRFDQANLAGRGYHGDVKLPFEVRQDWLKHYTAPIETGEQYELVSFEHI